MTLWPIALPPNGKVRGRFTGWCYMDQVFHTLSRIYEPLSCKSALIGTIMKNLLVSCIQISPSHTGYSIYKDISISNTPRIPYRWKGGDSKYITQIILAWYFIYRRASYIFPCHKPSQIGGQPVLPYWTLSGFISTCSQGIHWYGRVPNCLCMRRPRGGNTNTTRMLGNLGAHFSCISTHFSPSV